MDFCWLVEVEVRESGKKKRARAKARTILCIPKINLSSGFLRGPHKKKKKNKHKNIKTKQIKSK